MYRLKEYWLIRQFPIPKGEWDGNIVCLETDNKMTYDSNETRGYLSCYTFTLVTQGTLTILYNDREITLHKNDLYCYSPGFSISIISVSDDYRGVCLLGDEQFTLNLPNVRNAIRTTCFSTVELQKPCISLSPDDSRHIQELMALVAYYQNSHLPHASNSMHMVYGLFLNDLADIQEHSIHDQRFSKRTMELFTAFQNLVSRHFAEHHDIGFYASELCITSTYLSRVVRLVSGGHTVLDYINQLLLMEASFLLRQTSLSVAQIADRLHFAETSTFARFFRRMKGMSPKEYRNT